MGDFLGDGWIIRALTLIDRLEKFDEHDPTCQELFKILDELNADELRKLVKKLTGKYIAYKNGGKNVENR